MKRRPTDSVDDRPPCFGSPTLVHGGCLRCAARAPCVAEFSAGLTVSVLPRPSRTDAATHADANADRLFSADTKTGLDPRMLAALLETTDAAGLSPVESAHWPYRLVFKDGKGRLVVGVRRLDRRRAVLDAQNVLPFGVEDRGFKPTRGRDDRMVYRRTAAGRTAYNSLLAALASLLEDSREAGAFTRCQ